MKIKKYLSGILTAVAVTSCFFMYGCDKNKNGSEYYDSYYFSMDTYITLRLAKNNASSQPLSEEYLGKVEKKCADILSDADTALSAHNAAGELYALNQNINLMPDADDTLLSVMNSAFTICDLTDGAYDPTLGGLSELWNITGGGPVPDDSEIMESMLHTGTDKIKIDGNTITKLDPLTKIDFGGLGKGYAAQLLLEYLSSTDVPYGLVSLGGNIGVFGTKANDETYKIGIKDPNDPKGVIGYIYISGGFISVSGDYERFFEEGGKHYHHILDPVTGYPAESGLRSVVCYSMNGTSADALSTALFVMGLDKSLELYSESTMQFEAIFITDDNKVILTEGLAESGIFELTNDNYTLN